MIQGWGMTETNPLGTLSRKVSKRSQIALSEDQQFENIAKAGLAMPDWKLKFSMSTGMPCRMMAMRWANFASVAPGLHPTTTIRSRQVS